MFFVDPCASQISGQELGGEALTVVRTDTDNAEAMGRQNVLWLPHGRCRPGRSRPGAQGWVRARREEQRQSIEAKPSNLVS